MADSQSVRTDGLRHLGEETLFGTVPSHSIHNHRPVVLTSGTPKARSGRWSYDNQIETLIDGSEYFTRWFAELDALTSSSAEPRELRHTGWRLDNIGASGRYSGVDERLLPELHRAQASGVQIRIRLSGHALGAVNVLACRRLRAAGIPVHLDRRLSGLSASHHEKYTVFRDGDRLTALVGSLDLTRTRWDTQRHSIVSAARYPYLRAPTHDTGVAITGSAALDIARAFDDSLADPCHTRLADPCHTRLADPCYTRTSASGAADSAPLLRPGPGGSGSAVTVLRTTPLDPRRTAATREYSAATAYLDAISRTRNFLYMEDQYFWPVFAPSPLAGGDVLDRLLDILRGRDIDIYILLPAPRHRSPIGRLQAAQRHVAMSTLLRAQSRATGRVHFLTPQREGQTIYVHSKLLIVDDEYVQIGSGNVNIRSMFNDGELCVGIEDHHIASEFRARLWEEHLGVPREGLREYSEAMLQLDAALRSGRGNIREYKPPASRRSFTAIHRWLWDRFVNPSPTR